MVDSKKDVQLFDTYIYRNTIALSYLCIHLFQQHLARTRKTVGYGRETSASESESDENESEVYDLKQVRGDNVFITSLCVNDKNIEFEIDAGLTIISEELFNESFKNTGLHSSNIILKTYSGEKLNIMGKFPAEIKHNGEVYNHSIYVVREAAVLSLAEICLQK